MDFHRSIRTGGLLAVCMAAVLCLLTLQEFLAGSSADRKMLAANASVVTLRAAKAESDLDAILIEAKPIVLRTLRASQTTAENSRDLIAQIRRDTMPLVNANLIHADLVLGNAERASEHQEEASRKTLEFLETAGQVAKHTDELVTNPAIPRTFENTERGTARAADALDSGAKALDHVEKKLDQWLNPIRTAGQKVKAGFVEAGRWALRWFTR